MIGLHKFRLSVSFEIFCGQVIHNLTAFMLSLWLVSHIKWPNRIATDAVPDWHCDTTMWRPCSSWMFWVTPESFKQKLRLCIAIEKRIDNFYSQIMSNCMIWQFMPVKLQPRQPFQKWWKSMENRNRWCNFGQPSEIMTDWKDKKIGTHTRELLARSLNCGIARM